MTTTSAGRLKVHWRTPKRRQGTVLPQRTIPSASSKHTCLHEPHHSLNCAHSAVSVFLGMKSTESTTNTTPLAPFSRYDSSLPLTRGWPGISTTRTGRAVPPCRGYQTVSMPPFSYSHFCLYFRTARKCNEFYPRTPCSCQALQSDSSAPAIPAILQKGPRNRCTAPDTLCAPADGCHDTVSRYPATPRQTQSAHLLSA